MRGYLIAAGAGAATLEIDRVRQYPGGRWLDIDPREVVLTVPLGAEVEPPLAVLLRGGEPRLPGRHRRHGIHQPPDRDRLGQGQQPRLGRRARVGSQLGTEARALRRRERGRPQLPLQRRRDRRGGYDMIDQELKPADSHDLMGYCNDDWISDYTYLGVMNFRASDALKAGGMAAAVQPGLLVWGRIEGGGRARAGVPRHRSAQPPA